MVVVFAFWVILRFSCSEMLLCVGGWAVTAVLVPMFCLSGILSSAGLLALNVSTQRNLLRLGR